MRYIRIVLTLIILNLLFTLSLFAAKLSNITVNTTDTTTRVSIQADAPFEYRILEFLEPSRLVVDIEKSSYPWKERYLLVEDSVILGLRLSQSERAVRIVIDRTQDTRYHLNKTGNSLAIEFIHTKSGGGGKQVYLGEKPRQNKPTINPNLVGKITNILTREENNQLVFIVDGESLLNYQTFTLKEPERQVLDIKAVLAPRASKKHVVNRSGLAEVRLGQFKSQPNPVARVVFQFDRAVNYYLENFNGRPGLVIETQKAEKKKEDAIPILTLPPPVDKTAAASPPLPKPDRVAPPTLSIFNQTISLHYQNKPAYQVFNLLARKYNVTFQGDNKPRNRISIKLKDVSVLKAISEILSLCSYEYTREGNTFTLIKQQEQKKQVSKKPFISRPESRNQQKPRQIVVELKLIQLNSLVKDRLRIIWQPFKGSYNKQLVIGLPEDKTIFEKTLKQMIRDKDVKIINNSSLFIKQNKQERVVLGQRGEYFLEKRDAGGSLVLEKAFFDLGYKMVLRGEVTDKGIKLGINAFASVIPVSGVRDKPLVIKRAVEKEVESAAPGVLIIGGIIRSKDKLAQERKSLVRKIPLLGQVTASESVDRVPLEVMAVLNCRVE